MNKTKIQNRIAKLTKLINHWNVLYYEQDNPEVSDQIYDQHFQELATLERNYPELKLPNSPINQVGSQPLSYLPKWNHSRPMLSLNNAFNKKELLNFDKRISKFTFGQHTYHCEPKIDGLPISIIVRNHRFVVAATRGDGLIGENVSANVKMMSSLNKLLQQPFLFANFEIRGEVFITKQDFQQLNTEIICQKRQELLIKIDKKFQELTNFINHHFSDYARVDDFLNKANKQFLFQSNKTHLLNNIAHLGKQVNLELQIFFQSPQLQERDYYRKITTIFQLHSKWRFVHFEYDRQNYGLQIQLIHVINFVHHQFANARNAASGSLRQLKPEITKQRKLSVIFYDFLDTDNGNSNALQSQKLQILQKMHLPISKMNKHCQNMMEVFQYIDWINQERKNLSYDIDGVVIKVNEQKFYSSIGRNERFPNYYIAFKYPSQVVETQLLDIFPTVGRTGKITYNAKLKKVLLSGTQVSAATLHNADYIETLDIRVGDYVYVKKAGEIIPKVIKVDLKKRPMNNKKWNRHQVCPNCATSLHVFAEEVDQYCINEHCSEKNIKALIHFASRDAMNIIGLNQQSIRVLWKLGLLKNFGDIFRLKDHYDHLLTLSKTEQLSHFGFKSLHNLLQAIANSKQKALDRLLFALNIRYVGTKAAKLIAQTFPKIEQLFDINAVDLMKIEGVGPVLAKSVQTFFAQLDNISLIRDLQALGVNTNYVFFTKIKGDLTDKKVVITGVFILPRNDLISYLEKHNCLVMSTVSKNIDFVLVGQNPGSKLQKAKQLGIKILSEEQIYQILKLK